ncbi:MAG: lipoprotein-releasing ABC transporter permease subunit [Gammaproteobacteria bacterium]|nr:lipoprotein-releasing ABC transporter permease subunit [Gammaproteobacteria bacterium]
MVGTRYLRSTHHRGFVSFVAFMSMAGLTLGVAVLIVVLSVMNGFERELRSRILSVTSHATLMGLEGALQDWQGIRRLALQAPGVRYAVPYIEARAMIANGSRVLGSAIRGIDPALERKATGIAQQVRDARIEDLTPGSWKIILGTSLARELGVARGDLIVVIVPEGSATPAGVVPRMRRVEVVGTFESGTYEFDRSLALININDAARLYRLGSDVTGVRLALEDPVRAPEVVRDLALALGGGYYVSDWTRNHANFFQSIELTKGMMFIILLIIVGVAAFNIISTLVMTVKDKQDDIALLRTLGAIPADILQIFVVQGVLIGLVGTLVGAALGIVLADNVEVIVRGIESVFGIQFMDAKVYFMTDLPAYVEWTDVARVCGVAFALCALATLYPAWRASRTQPAEVLRHE